MTSSIQKSPYVHQVVDVKGKTTYPFVNNLNIKHFRCEFTKRNRIRDDLTLVMREVDLYPGQLLETILDLFKEDWGCRIIRCNKSTVALRWYTAKYKQTRTPTIRFAIWTSEHDFTSTQIIVFNQNKTEPTNGPLKDGVNNFSGVNSWDKQSRKVCVIGCHTAYGRSAYDEHTSLMAPFCYTESRTKKIGELMSLPGFDISRIISTVPYELSEHLTHCEDTEPDLKACHVAFCSSSTKRAYKVWIEKKLDTKLENISNML